METTFIRAGTTLVNVASVTSADCSRLSELQITVVVDGETYVLVGNDCIEAVYLLKPSIIEGQRLKFPKHSWVIHNLVAHPLMQLMALVGLPKIGIRIHDATIPKTFSKKPQSAPKAGLA